MQISSNAWRVLARGMVGCGTNRSFRAHFGTSPEVCSDIWEHVEKPRMARPRHLLWALLFLKMYGTEDVLASKVKTTRNTYRKWVWILIENVAAMYDDVIMWQSRLDTDGRNPWNCTICVDGTDFRIQHPPKHGKRFYSHKFKGPGLRYEVATSINGGNIVHTNGPFPCGGWPDINIFRSQLITKLPTGEFCEADLGYRGQPDKIRTPVDYANPQEKTRKKRARARHETCNRRFKQFGSLQQVYRHDLKDHQKLFRAIVVVTQKAINHGETLFFTKY